MADKMMRIGGRSLDDNTTKSFTMEIDDNGDAAVRMVDAAPHAYDPLTDSKKVLVLGSKKLKTTLLNKTETLLDSTHGTYPNYLNADRIELRPPAGKLWELQHFYFFTGKLTDATEGSHQFLIRYGYDSTAGDVMLYTQLHTGSFNVKGGINLSGGTGVTSFPDTAIAQLTAMRGMLVSNSCPIYIRYENKSNGTQTNSRIYYYVVVETDELP